MRFACKTAQWEASVLIRNGMTGTLSVSSQIDMMESK